MIEYPTKLEAGNGKVYDEVSRYLGEASNHVKGIGGKLYYFLDKEETMVIKTDGEKRIEISDLVEQDIIDSVNHILKTEKRENDIKIK